MTLHDLVSMLRAISPTLREVVGCVVLTLGDDAPPDGSAVAEALVRHDGDHARTEEEINRKFVIADVLDAFDLGAQAQRDPAALLMVADVLAALVHDAATRTYPARPFVVDVIGREGAEDEPLEVCVTVFRRRGEIPVVPA